MREGKENTTQRMTNKAELTLQKVRGDLQAAEGFERAFSRSEAITYLYNLHTQKGEVLKDLIPPK